MFFKELKEKINGKIIMAEVMLGTLFTSLMDGSTVYANDRKGKNDPVFDFLKEGTGTSNGAFDDVQLTIQQTGFSLYNLMLALGVLGLIISLMVLGIYNAATKNTSKKSENKSHVVDIVLGAVLIFGAMTIIGGIKSIVDAF